jgi:hypothetical protein
MPRRIEWLEQLPSALEELRQFPAPVVDRAILERVLRIHRRVAIRLMHRFGGFQSGKAFLIDRLQLVEQLERISRGEEVSFERDRRTRLVGQLTEARPMASGRHVRIHTSADVRDRVLKDLPAGIHLEPGELRIEFEGVEELLQRLYALGQVMANDYEGFMESVERSATGQWNGSREPTLPHRQANASD